MKKFAVVLCIGIMLYMATGCAPLRDIGKVMLHAPEIFVHAASKIPPVAEKAFAVWSEAITTAFYPLSILNSSERSIVDADLRKAEQEPCPDTFYADFFIMPTVNKNVINPFETRQEPTGYSAVSFVAQLNQRQYKVVGIKLKRVTTLQQAVVAIHEHTGYTVSYILRTHFLRQKEQIRNVQIKLTQRRR